MNIIAPIPTGIPVNPGAFNTEAARRDNQLRETIPAPTEAESSAAEGSIGSEGERARAAATQVPTLLVYERPQIQPQVLNAAATLEQGEENLPDNASDQSAGREEAESRQQEQAEQQEIRELQARDREVRAHEQAHATVGGQYAGAPSYEFETGPDGRQYAVGGEVSIDVSEEETPEESLRKFQQVEAAALAPAEPSPQDFRVAAEARQGANEARAEIARERAEEINNESPQVGSEATTIDEQENANEGVVGVSPGQPNPADNIPESGNIDLSPDIGSPVRSLETPTQANASEPAANVELPQREERFDRFSQRIADFYATVTQPEIEGFRQTA
jgi:hypothetical protein